MIFKKENTESTVCLFRGLFWDYKQGFSPSTMIEQHLYKDCSYTKVTPNFSWQEYDIKLK